MMISFIIIGYNEGWKLTKSLESVVTTIELNQIKDFEILYIDSQSSDDSINRAKTFEVVKIYQIDGTCNAAIARNIGASVSKGEVLFFIDGDMEILPDFLPLVFNTIDGVKDEFVSGNWINYNYDFSGRLISKNDIHNINIEDKYEMTTGGVFLISRHLWFEFGGMKSKLFYNEDIDFGIRLANKKIKLLRKKEIIAVHHTVPYNNKRRIFKLLFSRSQFYRIVLLRDNIFNPYQWIYFLRGNYTFIFLICLIFLSIINVNWQFILLYPPIAILRNFLRKDFILSSIGPRILYFAIYEFFLLFSLFLFWPKHQKENYTRIR